MVKVGGMIVDVDGLPSGVLVGYALRPEAKCT
jgi:hypothetical protein